MGGKGVENHLFPGEKKVVSTKDKGKEPNTLPSLERGEREEVLIKMRRQIFVPLEEEEKKSPPPPTEGYAK